MQIYCITYSYGSATVNQAADRKQDDGTAAGRVYDIKVEDFDISFGKRLQIKHLRKLHSNL